MDLLLEHISTDTDAPHLTSGEISETYLDLNAISQPPEYARRSIEPALALVRAAPEDHRPQLLAAILLERSQRKDNMLDTWEGLNARFPDLQIAHRYYVRWLNRAGRIDEAAQRIDEMIRQNQDRARSHELAELCSEIRNTTVAAKLFERLIATDPDNTRIRVIYGKCLFSQGDVYKAFSILDPLREQSLSKTARNIVEKSGRARRAMQTLDKDGDASSSVLTNAIGIFAERKPRPISKTEICGISFYTGSLGAGGAERQLTQMASAFYHRQKAGRNIYGTKLTGAVEVIVNSVDQTRGKDFFAPALKASGVPLHVTVDMPVQPLAEIAPEHEALTELMPLLPRNVRYGLERLVAHFRQSKPDVAYFWQDGSVLTGALAALIADVPRIAISLRGLPPNLRPNMMKPEYAELYRALSQIPGVTFSCNSRTAADAYADWLRLSPDRFSVIYNAIRETSDEGEQVEEYRWKVFAEETAAASFTLGAINRFNPNKRSLLWLDFACAAVDHYPNIRFVLVGDGEELAAAQAKAALLGIEAKCLFVGNSQNPGFWLSKMDALCLLSENEGLPNVLIEAQMARIPVISTPAGGASETFLDGKTGYLLSSAQEPSKEEFLLYLNRLIKNVPIKRAMGENARNQAIRKFDSDVIYGQTIRHFHGEHIQGDVEKPKNPKIEQLPDETRKTAFDPRVRDAYNVFAEI